MLLIPLMLLLQLGFQDAVSAEIQHEIQNARLQQPFTLNCTYNCSSGFTRGYWTWENTPACSKCQWKHKRSNLGDMCTVSLYIPHLIMEQTRYNYSCLAEESDRPGLPRKTELLVTLQVHDESEEQVTPPKVLADPSLRVKLYRGQVESDEVLTSLSTIEVMAGTSLKLHCVALDNKHCEVQWVRENGTLPLDKITATTLQWSEIKAEDSGRYRCHTKGTCTDQATTVEIEVITSDGFAWAKIFAAFAVSAVVILTAHLVYLCYRKGCKIMDSANRVHERVTSRSAVVIRPIAQDSQSDHEVPYADIVISVRGSSNPDLSDTFNQTSKNQRPRWKDDARAGLLHASADRLHIHSKEVTRKLSTTSEYAVITYSCEALS
ncbi:uncharacterized protein LOC131520686 [Onychostoma macrolepis]|uniref:Ig-like domain-containing protein n=1 Tax=Onychostoma macrolepis TaxID=369639 RepID=A0A7J6C9W2_9TELE|nr:uncharacterized protein LOC131520686 [Onychostoma macrolepis]KAF4104097.1 hypothetical protein G5714_015084 [Onychostoma macrolepis]